MRSRRLDDRIRYLCSRIADASDSERETILQELLSALHQKIEDLRMLTFNQLLGRKPRQERRAA